MSLACAQCPVRSRAACSSLTDAEREDLAARGNAIHLQRGQSLFLPGDDNDTCATLLRGALKVHRTDADGVETILALIHPAGFVGEMFAPFAGYEVTSIGESELCVFRRSDIEEAVARYPKLAIALLRRSQEDVHEARDLLDISRRKQASARMAGLILAFARAASDSPCHPAQSFDLPVSRADMASLLGLTIETVSRQLGKLEDARAIRRYGKRGIEVLDAALLAELAG